MRHQKIMFSMLLLLIGSLCFSCRKTANEMPVPIEPSPEPLNLLTDCSQPLENWNLTKAPRPDVLQGQNDIFFPSKEVGYTVGIYGTITKTEDGGRNWSTLHSGAMENYITRLNLKNVFFLNKNQGFVTGQSKGCCFGEELDLGAILLKTEDGGDTWKKYYFENTYDINGVYFYNSDIGYGLFIDEVNGSIVQKLMHTEDGGENWNEIDLPALSRIEFYPFFRTPSKLYIIAKDTAENPILVFLDRTDMTWHTQNLPQEECNHLFFINDEVGFMTCGAFSQILPNVVYKTENGGNSWTRIDSPINSTSIVHFSSLEEGFVITPVYQPSGHFLDLIAYDIFQTNNAGEDWIKSSYSPDCDFSDPTKMSFIFDKNTVITYSQSVNIFERK